MSAFYDDMQAVASELLAEVGAPVTVQVMTNGAYDPVLKTKVKAYAPTTGNGVFLNIKNNDTENSLVLTTDTKLLIENLSIVPTVDSTVVRNGETLTVIHFEPLSPTDTVLIYNIYLRK